MITRILVLVAVLAGCAMAAHADHSRLWGKEGEAWFAESRIPDFSFAGYRAGQAAIPDVPVQTNVRDFGATGDGETDDSEAFLQAIQATANGAILIPAGRYKLTRQLVLSRSGVVLRGEGEEKTTLAFAAPLSLAVGDGKTLAPGNSWSWSGGMIAVSGHDRGRCLAQVAAPARRGERRLEVDAADAVRPGQWVRLKMTDTDGSLARHLHAGQVDGSGAYPGKILVDFSAPVEAIEGQTLILERPLRTDVEMHWRPEVYDVDASVEECGIEHLAIEFPGEAYAGHHQEPGYNAIGFEGASHCWVRNVHIVNADSGLFLRNRTKFCTAHAIRFSATPGRLRTGYGTDMGEPQTVPVGGHHGVSISGFAQDNLVADLRFEFLFIHDIGAEAWSAGNVYSRVKGSDLSIDHHRRAPYENLFTEIDGGQGTRLWQRGGDLSDGPPSGARETFWNVRAATPQALPAFAVQWTIVGITTHEPSRISNDGNWWEIIAPDQLEPANLYEAQLGRRIGTQPGPD